MGYTISLYHEHQNSFFQRIMCRPLLRIGVFFAADAREVYPLNGSWDFSFNGKPAEKVTVPHTWNAEDAANGAQGKREDAKSVNSDAYRRGPAVYSRTLPVEPRPGKRYFIRGGGASIVSEVSVNGKPAGSHEGAFTAFCYEITPLLKKAPIRFPFWWTTRSVIISPPSAGIFPCSAGCTGPLN